MKNTSLILSIISLVAVVVFGILSLTKGGKASEAQVEGEAVETAATKGAIVYVDLDRILMEYDMANDLRSVVETKVQNIQAEVNRRGKKLENDVVDFQNKIDKGLLTRTNAEVQSQKLQQQEIEFNNYANQKNNEINEELLVMNNQINDAIATFIKKYNEEKQYAMIILTQGDAEGDGVVSLSAPVITADPTLDITNDVLAGLNEEYIASKNENQSK